MVQIPSFFDSFMEGRNSGRRDRAMAAFPAALKGDAAALETIASIDPVTALALRKLTREDEQAQALASSIDDILGGIAAGGGVGSPTALLPSGGGRGGSGGGAMTLAESLGLGAPPFSFSERRPSADPMALPGLMADPLAAQGFGPTTARSSSYPPPPAGAVPFRGSLLATLTPGGASPPTTESPNPAKPASLLDQLLGVGAEPSVAEQRAGEQAAQYRRDALPMRQGAGPVSRPDPIRPAGMPAPVQAGPLRGGFMEAGRYNLPGLPADPSAVYQAAGARAPLAVGPSAAERRAGEEAARYRREALPIRQGVPGVPVSGSVGTGAPMGDAGADQLAMGGAPRPYYPQGYQRTPEPLSRGPLPLNPPEQPFTPAPPQPPNDRRYPQMAGAEGREVARGSAGGDRLQAPGFIHFDRLTGRPGNGLAGGEFRDRLGGLENGGRYTGTNDLGYAGKYQFGDDALVSAGVYTPGARTGGKGNQWDGTFAIPGFPQVRTLQDFLATPEAQEAAADAHFRFLDTEIDRRSLGQFIGQTVGGVPITRDGLYAVMHLGGPLGAERFLKTGGRYNKADANGTKLSDYAAQFSGGSGSDTMIGQAGADTLGAGQPASGGPAASVAGAAPISPAALMRLQMAARLARAGQSDRAITLLIDTLGEVDDRVRPLSADEVAQLGLPEGTVGQVDATGKVTLLSEPDVDASPWSRLDHDTLYNAVTGETRELGGGTPTTTGLPRGYAWSTDAQGRQVAVRIEGVPEDPAGATFLARLIRERDALPANDPSRALYDRAIERAVTFDPMNNLLYGATTGGQAAPPPPAAPQGPSDFSNMTADELLAVDPSGLSPEQRSALEARYDQLGL